MKSYEDIDFNKIEKRVIVAIAHAARWASKTEQNRIEFDKLVQEFRRATGADVLEGDVFTEAVGQPQLVGKLTGEFVSRVFWGYLKSHGITTEDLKRMDDADYYWKDT